VHLCARIRRELGSILDGADDEAVPVTAAAGER
jgi:hypothetical protein